MVTIVLQVAGPVAGVLDNFDDQNPGTAVGSDHGPPALKASSSSSG
jgi:hypothetical protein